MRRDDEQRDDPQVAAVDDADDVEQLAVRQHVDHRRALDQADDLVDGGRHDGPHGLRQDDPPLLAGPRDARARRRPRAGPGRRRGCRRGRSRPSTPPATARARAPRRRTCRSIDEGVAPRRTPARTGCRARSSGTGTRGCTRAAAAGSAAPTGTPRCSPTRPTAQQRRARQPHEREHGAQTEADHGGGDRQPQRAPQPVEHRRPGQVLPDDHRPLPPGVGHQRADDHREQHGDDAVASQRPGWRAPTTRGSSRRRVGGVRAGRRPGAGQAVDTGTPGFGGATDGTAGRVRTEPLLERQRPDRPRGRGGVEQRGVAGRQVQRGGLRLPRTGGQVQPLVAGPTARGSSSASDPRGQTTTAVRRVGPDPLVARRSRTVGSPSSSRVPGPGRAARRHRARARRAAGTHRRRPARRPRAAGRARRRAPRTGRPGTARARRAGRVDAEPVAVPRRVLDARARRASAARPGRQQAERARR